MAATTVAIDQGDILKSQGVWLTAQGEARGVLDAHHGLGQAAASALGQVALRAGQTSMGAGPPGGVGWSHEVAAQAGFGAAGGILRSEHPDPQPQGRAGGDHRKGFPGQGQRGLQGLPRG